METLQSPAEIQTRCPTCQTVFEIKESLAQSHDPRVRCGECYSIFNSHDHAIVTTLSDDFLSDDNSTDSYFDESVASMVSQENFAMHDEQEVDTDLFSIGADLPEMSYLNDEEIPELDFESSDELANTQFDGTMFDDVSLDLAERAIEEQEATRDAGIAEMFSDNDFDYDDSTDYEELESLAAPAKEGDPDFIDDTLHSAIYTGGSERQFKQNVWKRRAGVFVALTLFFGGLFVYLNRNQLADIPVVGGVLCTITGCSSGLSNLDKISVVERKIFSHPDVENALVIDITFRNDANADMPFPILSIEMLGRNGSVVAERDFLPFEYLKIKTPSSLPDFKLNETKRVSLEVIDPGRNTDSFKLDFK